MPIGSIIGGIIGQQGALASGAAAGQAGQTAWNNAQQEAKFDRNTLSPWTSQGKFAVDKLGQLYGFGHLVNDGTGLWGFDPSNVAADQKNALAGFTASPGYQWRVDQGTKALDRSAAARGMLLSGAQGKALQDYGQNEGSNEWGNYINQLNALSGSGQTAQMSANNTAAGLINAGNALNFQGEMGRASSYSNAANALASGIGNGIKNLGSIASFGLGGGFKGF